MLSTLDLCTTLSTFLFTLSNYEWNVIREQAGNVWHADCSIFQCLDVRNMQNLKVEIVGIVHNQFDLFQCLDPGGPFKQILCWFRQKFSLHWNELYAWSGVNITFMRGQGTLLLCSCFKINWQMQWHWIFIRIQSGHHFN